MSETRRYAYVLTLQFPVSRTSLAYTEDSGTIDLPEGFSRNEVFKQIRQGVIERASKQISFVASPSTVFFSLEPDTL